MANNRNFLRFIEADLEKFRVKYERQIEANQILDEVSTLLEIKKMKISSELGEARGNHDTAVAAAKELSDQNEKMFVESNKLRGFLEETLKENEKLEQKIATIELENTSLGHEISGFSHDLEKKQRSLNLLSEKLEHLESRNRELEAQRESVHLTLNNKVGHLDQLNFRKKELSGLEGRLNLEVLKIQSEIIEVNDQTQLLTKSIETINQRIDEKSIQYDKIKEDISIKQVELNELKMKKKIKLDMEREVESTITEEQQALAAIEGHLSGEDRFLEFLLVNEIPCSKITDDIKLLSKKDQELVKVAVLEAGGIFQVEQLIHSKAGLRIKENDGIVECVMMLNNLTSVPEKSLLDALNHISHELKKGNPSLEINLKRRKNKSGLVEAAHIEFRFLETHSSRKGLSA